ncbi:MAG: sodium:dicarboxylate symporter [Phycisphaeraceae bacterium]|nr:sodium:dicarboxylate symporter [Phycisphaeraceae bacterium]
MKISRHTVLSAGIVAGLILGGIVGEFLFSKHGGEVPDAVLNNYKFFGDTFFINLLKMVLVPLVAASVIVGVASIGDPAHLGRLGGWTVLYYFATMVIAVLLGVALVTTVAPGDPHGDGSGIGAEIRSQGEATYDEKIKGSKRERMEEKAAAGRRGVGGALWTSFQNITKQMIPKNPIQSAAEGALLPVISFSLILGIALTTLGERGRPLLAVFESLFAVIMKLVDWILWLAPFGVFCLATASIAKIGVAQLFGPLAKYMLVVFLGLVIHAVIVLPLVLSIFGRTNPYRYMHQMRQALMTAFGTASSSATLPVSIDNAEELGGVSRKSARFVLPLGATINMDGTALYEAVAVVFLFQCYGIPLGGIELAVIVITATLAAVGAAGIPSAGLVTMVIVIEAVNNSLGGDKTLPLAAVGIILGVDRILDMCRTATNVWGDAVGAKIMSRVTTR